MPKENPHPYLDRQVVYNFMGTASNDIDLEGEDKPVLEKLGFESCVFDAVRQFALEDGLKNDANKWPPLITDTYDSIAHCPNGKDACTKKEFAVGFFQDYDTEGGHPIYPKQQIDFQKLFRQRDGFWEDKTEQFMAFKYIGQHRLEDARSEKLSHGGETVAFVLRTNSLAKLEHRPHFGRIGADMYFTKDGLPLMISTPDGLKIWRGEASQATWNYWKFVWRSSTFLLVTALDHLWFSHFSAGNMLAASTRETLAVDHPLRRFMTIFSYNTIQVNKGAIHQLVGPEQLLHRSSPFHDFHQVSEALNDMIPSLEDVFKPFVGDGINDLPKELQSAPLYQDGRLLYAELKKLVDEWFSLYAGEWCSASGEVADAQIKHFMERRQAWQMGTHFKDDAAWLGLYSKDGKALKCDGFRKWLTVQIFHVTGFHRHVGTVSDLASDPDFASFSWKAGEAFGRPRQHLQMMAIAASTSKFFPKLTEDYSFVASGLKNEAKAKEVLTKFQESMRQLAKDIDQKNEDRAIPFMQMDPTEVECSVAN